MSLMINYWMGRSRFVTSSANTFDLSSRKFGIEQEHFVFHDDGTPPTHDETDRLWDRLLDCGYQVHAVNNQGRVLAVSKPLPQGLLVITNDSCTHIVEVALPPFLSLSEFRDAYLNAWQDVENQLSHLGLKIVPGGSLENGIQQVHWRPKETDPEGERLYKLVHRSPLSKCVVSSKLPRLFLCHSHHLGVSDEDAVRHLPGYYAFEFSRATLVLASPRFLSVDAHCVRPLAWEANFHQPYPLLGVPDPLPRNLAEYSELRTLCPMRDYSFVAIRNEERLEFRSACSQTSLERMELLIRFRLAVDQAVHDGLVGSWCAKSEF